MEQLSPLNIEEGSEVSECVEILHVDDHFSLAVVLDNELKKRGNFIFYNAHDEAESVNMLRTHRNISIVILDLNLKGKNGFDLVPSLRLENPGIKILIYSAYTERFYIENAMKLGVQGYVSKDLEITELLTAIGMISNGKTYFPEELNVSDKDTSQLFEIYKKLTKKEQEIFLYTVQLKGSREISAILGKSERTINNQKSIIFEKFFVSDTLGLLKCAKILGLL